MTVRTGQREMWMAVHRYIGLVTMLFLSLAALTGCLLVFDQPLDEALNADLFVRGEAKSVDPVTAVERFERSTPTVQVVGFPLHVAADRNIPVSVNPKPGTPAPPYDTVFLDGGTGEIVGTRDTAPAWNRRGLMPAVAQFHADLLAGVWGQWFMAAVALGWLVSNFVGVYLTWPLKRPYWRTWKRMWQFRFASSPARLLLDLHRASGLWLLGGVTVLAATSVALNLYTEAYEPTVTQLSPLKRSLFDRPAPFPNGATPTLAYRDALTLAEKQAGKARLEWQPATLLYKPEWNLYGVTFTHDGLLNYQKLGPIYYYFDARTGRFAHEVNPYTDSAGLVMIRILYPLHSGDVGGAVTQAVVFVLGLATLLMSGTGCYVWWKKRRSRVASKRAQARRAEAG
ncbi:PepSY-associated TM helix domain-containing protein [Sphingobium subterraneum]|uniref:Putative iron-regulated membrane protein n=1 Tax=Sphingobium subterraneum TaxID=627688 RepID=A0A841J692_9SPHN|nr:PepSY-associated TM helix domain-containing protein [Sphingobium subterraneum]MBB6123731.1 putative iron-regulated membrane protein [Sphingobium subterraneum]